MEQSLQSEMIEFRARNRLSQGKLAQLCGVSTQTINNVENGIQTPSKLTEAKIRLVIKKKGD